MKRILIFLLFLALAGGLFAQVTWTGSVVAGLGATKLDGEDDWAFGTGTGTILANDNYRLRLNGTYTNDEGTAGGRFRVQSQGSATSWTTGLSIPYASGWLSFADGLLKVLGGRISENEFNAVDSWNDGSSFFTSEYGLQAYVYPADIFRLGIGAKASSGVSEKKNMDGMTGWLGLGTDLNALSLAAQMEAGKDNVNAFLSVSFEGLSNLGLTLGAYAGMNNITNFSDEGSLEAALSVEYSGLLDAWLYVVPTLPQASGEDMFLGLNVGAEYALGNITPGLDVNFVLQGGGYDGLFDWEETYAKDHSYVGFKPYVQVTPNSSSAYVKLGYLLAMDLSKIEPPNGKKGGMNHGAFIDFSWSF